MEDEIWVYPEEQEDIAMDGMIYVAVYS